LVATTIRTRFDGNIMGLRKARAQLNRIPAPDGAITKGAFNLNRAIVQQGTTRMMVYYWYEQQGNRTASIFGTKLQLMLGKLLNGRNDSAIVRLTTSIRPQESDAKAEARLIDSMIALQEPLPRFVPGN
jgi:EpsI family protein